MLDQDPGVGVADQDSPNIFTRIYQDPGVGVADQDPPNILIRILIQTLFSVLSPFSLVQRSEKTDSSLPLYLP